MSCAKMAEPIEMPLGAWTWVGPRNRVLHGAAHHETADWRHLANMIEQFVCSGDATFCQITMTTCHERLTCLIG